MKTITLIKLGGSLITNKNKPFTANKKVIERLSREIKTALKTYKGNLLIAHGSGSFGHTVASIYKTQEGIINKKSIKGFPLVADAARKINVIVMDKLLEVKLPVISFSPLSFIYTKNQKAKRSLVNSIEKALSLELIPVVYGDVIMDEQKGFCIYSGEKTLNLLTTTLKKKYKIQKIIFCGDTDGVYDSKGKTIPKISSKNSKEVKKLIGDSKLTDVTGGMLHKVEEGLKMAKNYKAKIYIINGNKRGILYRCLKREKVKGTIVSS